MSKTSLQGGLGMLVYRGMVTKVSTMSNEPIELNTADFAAMLRRVAAEFVAMATYIESHGNDLGNMCADLDLSTYTIESQAALYDLMVKDSL